MVFLNKQIILINFFFIVFLSAFSQQSLTGKVIAITDGDTFKLLTQDSIQVKVRVANIDCPERKQPFYQKSKQFTSDAIFNKIVVLNVLKTDRYRRLIAKVYYDESLELGKELVKNGYAWHYVKYSNDESLQELEDTAKANKLGLFIDPNAIPPWQWRDDRKKSKKAK